MLEILHNSPVLRLAGNTTVALRNIRPPAKTLSLSAEALVDATAPGHLPQLLHVAQPHHATVPYPHHALQPEALPEILHHSAQRDLVQTITGKDMVGYRPALHHHHPEQNLAMTGFAVPAVATAGQLRRPLAFKVGGGQVVENQVRLQTEQIAEAEVEIFFDAPFVRQKVVESLVP